MGQLTNQYVSQSYQGLLKLQDSTTGVTSTLQYVQDGVGNNIPIQVSTSSVVITGSFRGDGSGLTGITANVDSGSLVTTASFNAYTSSQSSYNNFLVDLIATKVDTGSFNSYTSSNDNKVNSLISATGSYATTSSVTSLSQSIAVTDLAQNGRLTSLETFTGSINNNFVSEAEFGTYTSSMNSFTTSIDGRVDALEIATGSLQNQINQKLDTGSFNTYSGSTLNLINQKLDSSSFNSYTSSNDAKVNSLINSTGSYVTETESGSFMVTGSVAGNILTFTKGNGSTFNLEVTVETGSLPSGLVSSSAQVAAFGYATTSSVNTKLDTGSFNTYSGDTLNLINTKLNSSSFNSYTSSNDGKVNDLISKTGSYATTGSNIFQGTQTITGSLNVTGEITALSASITYLETIYQTSSVLFSSGSNILGDEAGDTQTLYGTVNLPTGPLTITGSLHSTNIKGTGSLFLQPNQGDARFVEIYNTSPTDTHITASGGQIFLGDDQTYVKVDNYGSVERIDIVAGNELVVSSSVVNVTSSLHQSGTFYPDVIDWFSSSIVQNTGSYILTTDALGVTQYDSYQNVASALQPFINTGSLPAGLVSGSSQISYTGITDVPSGIVSGSGQVSYTGITNVPAGIVSGSQQIVDLGFATTSSVTSLSQSIAVTDLAQDNRLGSLETATGSLQNQINQKLDTGSFNSYTSSNDGKVNSLINATGSYVTETESGSFMTTGSVAGDTLTFTKGDGSQFSLQVSVATGSLPAGVVSGSQQIVDLGFATTSSVNTKLDTGSFNTYSGDTLNLINQKLDTGSFNSYTSSNDSKVNSLISQTGSYVTETESGSFMITGSVSGPTSTFTKGDGSQFSLTVNNVQSASHAINADTASFATNVVSSSYAENAGTASIARDVIVTAKCNNAGGLTKGTVVRIVGADGNNPLIDSASYINETESANVFGMLSEDVAFNAFANVVVNGKVIGLNTVDFPASSLLFLSSSGQYTTSSIVPPLQAVRLGQVLRQNVNQGSIYFNAENGYELGELHNVIDTATTTGELLSYVSGSYGLWQNKSFSQLGLATTGSNRFVGNQTITGSVNISGNTVNNTNGVNTQYLGSTFGGNVGVFNVSNNTEIGLALDGNDWTTNWSTGPILYVNNTAGDTYEAVFGFQNKANYTDGRVTVVKPIVFNAGATGSLQGTASFATQALSASFAPMPDVSYFATTGSNIFRGNQTITGSVLISGSATTDLTVIGNIVSTGSALINTNNTNIQYLGSSFGGNIGVYNVSNNTEIGLALDGNDWTTNWSNGPIMYVNNTPGDTYEGVFGFQNKTNYTDGRITALKPMVFNSGATITGSFNVTGSSTLSGNGGFPLTVDGTINSKRLHFDKNPFNSDPSSNLGALRLDGFNQTFYLTNYDLADFANKQSVVGLFVNTGSNTVNTYLHSLFNGTTAKAELMNLSGSRTFRVDVDSSAFTGSLTVSGGITGSLEGTASFATTASFALNGGGGGSAFPYVGVATITGSLLITGSAGAPINATNGIVTQYFGNSFGGNIGINKNSDFTEIGLALDGAAWTTNWSTGPILYVNNTAGDTYEAVFGFQDKTNYTDGRVAVLKPINFNAGATGSFRGDGSGLTGITASAPSNVATTGSNVFIGNQTITGSLTVSGSAPVDLRVVGQIVSTGSALINTDNVNVQYLGSSFGGNLGVFNVSNNTEIGLALDGASWTGNWSTGPILYVNNNPGDTYDAVFGFQNKANYSDGKVTVLKPMTFNSGITGSLTVTGQAIFQGNNDFPVNVQGTITSKRFSFNGNPFNSTGSGTFGSLNYDGTNTQLQYVNGDFGTPQTSSYTNLTTNTGSNLTQVVNAADYAGTSAKTTLANTNGTRTFEVDVNRTSITGSLAYTMPTIDITVNTTGSIDLNVSNTFLVNDDGNPAGGHLIFSNHRDGQQVSVLINNTGADGQSITLEGARSVVGTNATINVDTGYNLLQGVCYGGIFYGTFTKQ